MTVRGDKMKDIQWKKIIYIIFYCVLVMVFLWKFGHPALVKYMTSQVTAVNVKEPQTKSSNKIYYSNEMRHTTSTDYPDQI